jgi:hypothetical protein
VIPLGHIAGIPVEETALSFGPVLLTAGGVVTLKVRERLGRLRGEGSRGERAGRGDEHPRHRRP